MAYKPIFVVHIYSWRFKYSFLYQCYSFKKDETSLNKNYIWLQSVLTSTKGYVSLDRLICFFAYFVLFGSRKKKVVDFYLPNSRFHWLFQEPAQDLTLFNFLKENCYIGWMTYKSTAYTESNKYFYIFVSKSVRHQENYCY